MLPAAAKISSQVLDDETHSKATEFDFYWIICRCIRSSATGMSKQSQDDLVDGLPLPPGSTGCPFVGETISFFQDYIGFNEER